jgi:DNA (cytosine-5)-methyltransferase 1
VEHLYNEWDPRAAAWLRQLITDGRIPAGTVDERSINDVNADELSTTAHLFAGIGGWAYALRLAGWPDDQPVWTASLPCQPFSSAGKQRGTSDDRHLWPIVRELVAECRPSVIFGEQSASPAGRAWLATVRDDLEALGYAVGAADLCAAGVGAPHIRQRLYWGAVRVADSGCIRLHGEGRGAPHGASEGVRREAREQRLRLDAGAADSSDGSGLGYPPGGRLPGKPPRHVAWGAPEPMGAFGSGVDPWASLGLVLCADGRARPLAPVARRLDHGVPHRVGLLRGYGNAIVPQLGAAFVRAFVASL